MTTKTKVNKLKELIAEMGRAEVEALLEDFDADELNTITETIEPSELADWIEDHGSEKIKAAIACDVQMADIDEAYQGQYKSDRDFAQEMADQLGEMPKGGGWPHYCIDWDYAARELMMDYCSDNGHYFRNL